MCMNKYAHRHLDKEEAQQLYDSGMSTYQLAAHYGVGRVTIQRLNLTLRTLSESRKLAQNYRILPDTSRESLSDHAKKNGLGGYRPHPNKGQYHNNVWFDSKWEVKVAIELDNANIKWERPVVGFVWSDTGRKYYPDFYLPDFDIYLDPKNPFLQKKDKTKIEEATKRHSIRILVLNENQLDWKSIHALIVQ